MKIQTLIKYNCRGQEISGPKSFTRKRLRRSFNSGNRISQTWPLHQRSLPDVRNFVALVIQALLLRQRLCSRLICCTLLVSRKPGLDRRTMVSLERRVKRTLFSDYRLPSLSALYSKQATMKERAECDVFLLKRLNTFLFLLKLLCQ